MSTTGFQRGDFSPAWRLIPAWLLAGLTLAGCAAPPFAIRPAPPAAADPARTWSVADCFARLEKPSAAADPAARQAAAARLVELYAPAMLAASDHSVRVAATGAGRAFRLRLRRGAGPGGADPGQFVELTPADRYTVKKAPQLVHVPGAGTPLVGILRPMQPVRAPDPEPATLTPGLARAVTAVPVVESAAGSTATLDLDLYDPHTTGHAPAPGRGDAPLAADYTTPQAVNAQHFSPQRRGLAGFLHGNEYYSASGLYPLEQPTPDKIPLILVHGLISDPGDFGVLVNALNADAEFRRRYQVWVFYYPSSLPVPYSAMRLREDLAALVRKLDPAGTHPPVHRMVLLGHSMGGLLSRLAVSDGGDRYYRHFFRRPVDELDLTSADRALMRRAFYYRANPDVAAVIFVATPHGGSGLAQGFPGNLARLLVRVPKAVAGRTSAILVRNRDALAHKASLKPASSLDSLSPRDPLILAVNDLPMCPCVSTYSILGDRGKGGPPEKTSDGVVHYKSSHLSQAKSERIVPAGHTGTLSRPETAAEILRILRSPND